MDERVLNNESSRPVINDLAEIDKYFVSAYREYVNNLKYKVEHDNFTSYGDLNIYQNETMMIYRIPVDITCPKFNKFFVCDKVDTTDSIILSLKQKYASFLQYYNVMNNILNEVDDYLFSPDSNSLFFTDFLRNLVKNNSISRLAINNGATFIGNSNISIS